MPSKLNVIREKCLASNPDIRLRRPEIYVINKRDYSITSEEILPGIKIGIVDILISLKTLGKAMSVTEHGYFESWEFFTDNNRWNLRDDDLSHQSEETIDFIYSLLT